jgi:alkylhydroperoxidase family enzyme
MTAFIAPPPRIPVFLRFGLWIARRKSGKDLLPAQLLTWYPRAAIGAGLLESLIAHDDGRTDERMLKLVRMTVSFTVECPFCVGLNSDGWERLMTPDELRAIQGVAALADSTLTTAERLAVEYARLASATPLSFPPEFVARLTAEFTEREIVVLASTAAQVNYWARLIQALGAPPEG